MSVAAGDVQNQEGAPSAERLAASVRRGLGLDDSVSVTLDEVSELANINYVYRVEVPGRSLYLKVIPERPKRFPVRLPRERVFSEAEAIRRFHGLAGDAIVIPEILFLDETEMAFGMSDVGEGREVLFNVLSGRFDLLADQADSLGRALGAIHRGTRGAGSFRPPQEEGIIRKIVFDGLLGPGAHEVFPESWDAINAEMQSRTECLIHSDLWSKNLLVRKGAPVAVVDFEGVCYGDPSFDLGTLHAVALLPAIERVDLLPDAFTFGRRLFESWAAHCGSDDWADQVERRTYRAVATFLATRAFGPFAYTMSDASRHAIRELSRSLATDPPMDRRSFERRVAASTNPTPAHRS
jgi:aminoglycoside phosphotransferase (APT) family kinase protein